MILRSFDLRLFGLLVADAKVSSWSPRPTHFAFSLKNNNF